MRAELLFQGGEERGKDVDHEAFGLCENFTDLLVDDGVENDRARSVFLGSIIDLLYHGARFFNAIDIRARELGERDGFELRQQTLTQGFGGDTGAIGDEESGSFHLRHGP